MENEHVCPLSCGWCCETSWNTVKALVDQFPLQAVRQYATREECPNLGKKGCKLPREERPAICRSFLCDVGAAIIEGEITLEWAKEQMAKHGNNPIYVWNEYNNGKFKTPLPEETIKQLEAIREKLNAKSQM